MLKLDWSGTTPPVTCLFCASCGREYDPEDGDLMDGSACPSDDCPSHHEEA